MNGLNYPKGNGFFVSILFAMFVTAIELRNLFTTFKSPAFVGLFYCISGNYFLRWAFLLPNQINKAVNVLNIPYTLHYLPSIRLIFY